MKEKKKEEEEKEEEQVFTSEASKKGILGTGQRYRRRAYIDTHIRPAAAINNSAEAC